MITKEIYSQLALHVYQANKRNINKPLLSSPWVEIPDQPTGTFGFAYAVYKNTATNEIVISYRGTDNDVGDWATNLGVIFAQEAQAAEVYARVLRDYGVDAQGSNISFTGHSLGGGLAASMAVWFNRPATVFDPAPSESLSKDMTVLRRVEVNLGNNIPEAFRSYIANVATQFAVREANVTSYAAPGSIVYVGNSGWNVITGNGQNNQVLFGIQNMGGMTTGMVQMHSQALLTAGILEKKFADATIAVQTALPIIMNELFYNYKTTSSDRNFLIDLIRSEQTNSGNGKLTHFAADLQKLGTNIAGLNKAAQDAIIAQGIEWYYWQSNNYGGQEFFTVTGTLLQYTTAQGAGLEGALNKAFQYTSKWIEGLSNISGMPNVPLYAIKADYDQWNVVSSNGSAITATAKDENKTQIYVGSFEVDTFTGGNFDDVFFSGDGADTLDGGKGNDYLYGGNGADTYQFSGSFGTDTVIDADGSGTIKLEGNVLTGGNKIGDGLWKKGTVIYAFLPGADGKGVLQIYKEGDTVNSIKVLNWQNNQMGIMLDEAAAVPAAGGKKFTGDQRAPIKINSQGKEYYDWGVTTREVNGTLTGGVAEVGFADVLIGTSFADKIEGLGGNDALVGDAGNDQIDGGDGDDSLFSEDGADTLQGGLGVFNCKHHRKHYKNNSCLGNGNAGCRNKLHLKRLSIDQIDNSMKEVQI
jgi:RTX calcium-binding nonapeptide repeat (4 copies)/Protein of unknown function (DUF2974)